MLVTLHGYIQFLFTACFTQTHEYSFRSTEGECYDLITVIALFIR